MSIVSKILKESEERKKYMVVIQYSEFGIKIFESSWPREIGDKLDGGKVMAKLANEEEKNAFIQEWNKIISAKNSEIRKQNKAQERTIWQGIFDSNEELQQMLGDLYNYKNKGIFK